MISYLSLSESSVQVSVFSSSCITTVLKKVPEILCPGQNLKRHSNNVVPATFMQ